MTCIRLNPDYLPAIFLSPRLSRQRHNIFLRIKQPAYGRVRS